MIALMNLLPSEMSCGPLSCEVGCSSTALIDRPDNRIDLLAGFSSGSTTTAAKIG